MVLQGVPLTSIQETLGHTDFALTKNVYGHLLEDVERDGATHMDASLQGR